MTRVNVLNVSNRSARPGRLATRGAQHLAFGAQRSKMRASARQAMYTIYIYKTKRKK